MAAPLSKNEQKESDHIVILIGLMASLIVGIGLVAVWILV